MQRDHEGRALHSEIKIIYIFDCRSGEGIYDRDVGTEILDFSSRIKRRGETLLRVRQFLLLRGLKILTMAKGCWLHTYTREKIIVLNI